MSSFYTFVAGVEVWGFLLAMSIPFCTPFLGESDVQLNQLEIPEGFQIEVFAEVPGARSLTMGNEGTIFVGTRKKKGSVYAVVDQNGDFVADKVYTLVEDLYMPNGVAFREGNLYVAEVDRILRFDDIEKHLDNPPEPVVVQDDLPSDQHHGWKYIAFGPDNKLYVPVGAPCNVCKREDKRYASLLRMTPAGNELEVFAEGIRNTVGFDWHPQTNELWFTDNGRDWLGDNKPPDELNHAPTKGLHFGFPYCHGGDIPDPKFGAQYPCDSFVSPAQKLGPHVAALDMLFYTGNMFPDKYKHQIFIAEHGSWNRSTPIGYRIMLVRLENGKPVSYKPFVKGWLQGNDAWGRPVAFQQLPDGSLLISDDHAGLIYRLSYRHTE